MLDNHLIAHTGPIAHAKNIFISDDVRITVLSDRLFRVEKGSFCDEATQAVWFRDMPQQKFKAKKSGDIITVKTSACELVLSSDLSGCVRFGRKKVPLSNQGNLLGTYRTLDGCDGGTYIPYDGSEPYEIKLENGVCSRNGVAIYDDSKSLVLQQDGKLSPRQSECRDIYIFA